MIFVFGADIILSINNILITSMENIDINNARFGQSRKPHLQLLFIL